MPTWKKVIVSGSDAHLASVTASVFHGGSFSGSFSGSFQGSGAGLTGIVATTYNPPTAVTDITANTARFFISQSTGGEYITYGNLLTDLAGTNLAVEGTDSLTLSATVTGLTSVSATSFTGSLTGSVTHAHTASLAATASFLPAGTYQITAATASTVSTTTTSTNATYYIPFVASSTGIASEVLRVDAGIKYNPSTDSLTIDGDLVVNGTTTTINTTDLLVEDKFILVASGSTTAADAGIMVDRGGYASASVVFGFDADTERWGFQNGLNDTNNAIAIANPTASAFVGLVLTEGAHGGTKPTAGEFVKFGAMYVATNEDIWIYS